MNANAGSSSGRPQDELHGFQLEDVPIIDLREVVESPQEIPPPQDIPPAEAPAAPAGKTSPEPPPPAKAENVAVSVEVPSGAPAPQASPAQEALAPGPAARRPDTLEGGDWLVPFLAGALAGAGGFYATLWLLALI